MTAMYPAVKHPNYNTASVSHTHILKYTITHTLTNSHAIRYTHFMSSTITTTLHVSNYAQ